MSFVAKLFAKKTKKIPSWFLLGGLFLAFIGMINALYLTIEHLSNLVVTCPIFTPHCDAVLTSKFAELWGIPVALFGVLYYLSVFLLLMIVNWQARNLFFVILFIATFFGFIFSIILVYIQIWVLSAVCAYCMLSAGISILLFSSDLVYMLKEKIKCGQIEQTNDSTHDL